MEGRATRVPRRVRGMEAVSRTEGAEECTPDGAPKPRCLRAASSPSFRPEPGEDPVAERDGDGLFCPQPQADADGSERRELPVGRRLHSRQSALRLSRTSRGTRVEFRRSWQPPPPASSPSGQQSGGSSRTFREHRPLRAGGLDLDCDSRKHGSSRSWRHSRADAPGWRWAVRARRSSSEAYAFQVCAASPRTAVAS